MFFPLPYYNVVDISWLSMSAVFQKLKLGDGDWKKVPGHCIFSWATSIFASRYSRYFIHVSKTAYHMICQGFTNNLWIFKKLIFLSLFLPRIVHLYKILVQLYFVERRFSFRLLSILALSLLILFLTIFHEDVIPFFWRNGSITYRPKFEKNNN